MICLRRWEIKLMKIMHLMLACFYIDNYSYQENLLPKYHKKQGHDVEIVASLFTFDKNGNGMWLPKADKYVNEHGTPVTRLEFKFGKVSKMLRRYVGLENELERFEPELIFIHGVQFCDMDVVVKYLKKHPGVKVYADNHADFSNSAKGFVSRYVQHRVIWRRCARIINPFVTKFYGVLPARVDFLVSEYKLPKDKVELLVMGADDESVAEASNPQMVETIRRKYGIANDDFLIMYCGKTDNYKKQTLLLMDAVNSIYNPRLKLIVFGSVIPELKEEIEKRCSDRVKYIGWVLAKDTYKYYAAANLACFPGRHSVFWEQVAGQGIPLLVKRWDGTTHVDCGGNVRFLVEDTMEEIKAKIEEIFSAGTYEKMLISAKNASSMFMYSEIAKRSINVK